MHSTAQLQYRADIDGMRAIAVMAVVLFHAFPKVLPGGFVGVDAFFVISGYLITSIIVDDLDGDGFSFADFYARRVRRLFPALIVVLIATLAAGFWILLPSALASLAKNAMASAFFSANLMLWSETGYFDIEAKLKPLLHLWSLGIEEQFYFAWPLALWLTPRRWRTVLIIGTIIGSFALNIALIGRYPEATFYLPFTRIWELIAGALLVGISVRSEMLREIVLPISAMVIAAMVCFLYDGNTPSRDGRHSGRLRLPRPEYRAGAAFTIASFFRIQFSSTSAGSAIRSISGTGRCSSSADSIRCGR